MHRGQLLITAASHLVALQLSDAFTMHAEETPRLCKHIAQTVAHAYLLPSLPLSNGRHNSRSNACMFPVTLHLFKGPPSYLRLGRKYPALRSQMDSRFHHGQPFLSSFSWRR